MGGGEDPSGANAAEVIREYDESVGLGTSIKGVDRGG